eukprot:gene10832-7503_t
MWVYVGACGWGQEDSNGQAKPSTRGSDFTGTLTLPHWAGIIMPLLYAVVFRSHESREKEDRNTLEHADLQSFRTHITARAGVASAPG